MSNPADPGVSHGEESREEMLEKLVFINAFIINAKKERTRLFDKIARMLGDQDGSGPDIATRSTEESQDGQVLQSGLYATDAKHVKSTDLKGGLEGFNVTHQQFINQSKGISISDDKMGRPDRNNFARNSLSENSRPGDKDQTPPLDEIFTIQNPPSSQHFPFIKEEHGVPVRLPACVRHGPFQTEPVASQSVKAVMKDTSDLGNLVSRDAIPFRAIVDLETSENFIIKSFVSPNVTTRDVFFGDSMSTTVKLPDHCTVNFTFTSRFQQNEPETNGLHLGVSSWMEVPIEIGDHFFWPTFFICEKIFTEEEYDKKFTAVLGTRFLCDTFVRLQWTPGGWLIRLPPPPPAEISNLIVYAHGCIVDAGAPALKDSPARDSKCGYGLHFPTLPDGWDLYAASNRDQKYITIEQAEITAIFRALQLVYERLFRPCRSKFVSTKTACKRIVIYTNSNYAVDGFHEHLPKWRDNGFKNRKKKTVMNADCWKRVDNYDALFAISGTATTLMKVTSEENQVAEKLARMGALEAQTPAPGQRPFMDIMGKSFMDAARPLIQYSGDGPFWVTNDLSKVGRGKLAHDTEETGQNSEESGQDSDETGPDAEETR